MSRKLKNPGKFDVVVVLGAAVWENAEPSPALRRRILHAVDLYLSGAANTLLVTGGVGKYPPSEAQVMRRLSMEHGIPGENIVLEETAQSTLESAMACADIIKKNNWKTALIVTDKYHLFRSLMLFRQFGIRVEGSATDGSRIEMGRSRWWHMIFRELCAIPWNIIRTLIHRSKRNGKWK